MKHFFIYLITFFSIYCNISYSQDIYDLTIIGTLDFSKGLPQIPISIIDSLKNDLKINFIPSMDNSIKNIPTELDNYLKKQNNQIVGNVAILTDVLWLNIPKFNKIYQKIPNSKIKIAYSMFETSQIPKKWVQILNTQFDLVVVPDSFLVEVYKSSGVKIPIFVLPLALNLDEFLKQPVVKKGNKNNFTFGCSAALWDRKNVYTLIGAFLRNFKNNKKVHLKIHTSSSFGVDKLKKLIRDQKAENIEIVSENLNKKEYIQLLSSLDCYVLISKGEGFSITPREALALAIPCILSNNTAHKTICKTGYVSSVKSDIKERAFHCLLNDYCGYQYNSKIEDICKALLQVYNNYEQYLLKAKKARSWVEQYLIKNLHKKYLNLIKPKRIIFGQRNEISDEYLQTNSKQLYKKYLSL